VVADAVGTKDAPVAADAVAAVNVSSSQRSSSS